MLAPPNPIDESARVSCLDALGVLYTPAEERFDRITRLAARLLDVPIALVSLVGSKCQWFKSSHGLDAAETPRAVSFCGHAILGDDTMIVPDALLDERFADNPLVVGEPFIRFYAGRPLKSADGNKLGTLCVIDSRPRRLPPDDVITLRDLAAVAESELNQAALSQAQQELVRERDHQQRKAMIDDLTRLWNRRAILEVLEREIERGRRLDHPLSIVMCDVDRFKAINDGHGHVSGDAVLREVARRMRSAVRPYDAIGRYGGEEFLMVLSKCGEADAIGTAQRVRERIAGSP